MFYKTLKTLLKTRNTFGPTCTYNMVSLFSQLGFTPYFFRCYKYVPFGIDSKVLSLCQVPGHVFYHCYERTILYPMHQENTLYSGIRQPIQILSKFLRHLLGLQCYSVLSVFSKEKYLSPFICTGENDTTGKTFPHFTLGFLFKNSCFTQLQYLSV